MDIYDKVTQNLIALLERGVKPWTRPWSAGAGAAMPLRHNGQPYRGINILILWSQAQDAGYASPYWMTYRQALLLGGQVRKGERSTQVVYYGTAIKEESGDDGEQEKKRLRFLRAFNVFNSAQIDGLPTRFQAAGVAAPVSAECVDRVESLVRHIGVQLRYGGNRAFYRLSDDLIQMPERSAFRDPEQLAATLLHEGVHSTRHPSRLDRDLGCKRWGDAGYAAEEIIAELGAAFLGAELGLRPDHIEDHASYIGSWLKSLKGDRRFIFAAAANAQEAADCLLGRKAGEALDEAA